MDDGRTLEEQEIVEYLENCLRDAQLYTDVYDNYESMRECDVLPDYIAAIKRGDHRRPYQSAWVVEPEDLAEYEQEMSED